MRNLVNFHQSKQKSQNWDFYWVLLSKTENVWAWNSQESYGSWQWWMMQNLKRNWLVSSKLTWGIWQILTPALENFTNIHFNGLLLTKVYNDWATKTTDELCLIALKIDEKFEENWLALSKMTWKIWQIFVHRLKNTDFILESKKVELNQNQNSKQPNQPDAVWKLYFTSKINE